MATVPTAFGWSCLIAVVAILSLAWWFGAEKFLSETNRVPGADVLVVEGWIGSEGVRAAKSEFENGSYRWIVTTGGFTAEGWSEQRWNYGDIAERELLALGFPASRLIAAPAPDVDNQRTFESALAVQEALLRKGIACGGLVVFTRGSHARRSRLIFSKVVHQASMVGVISWVPPTYRNHAWWNDTVRADDLLKESVGYLFEVLLSSGRGPTFIRQRQLTIH